MIRAGFVQGAPGPAGIPGPKGDTGRPGADGNTILHGAGAPTPADGKQNDFYIDTARSWLYGPKAANGSWGSPVKLKPDPATLKLPTGFKAEQGDAIYPRVFAGAMAGGGGGGTVVIGGGSGGGTLATIFNHGQPLPSGAAVLNPDGSVKTPTVWTTVASDSDPDGDAFIADIWAEGPGGAQLVELAVMRDSARRTGYSQVYEVRTGTPPNLNFQAITDPATGNLTLQMWSDQNLAALRGRVLYI